MLLPSRSGAEPGIFTATLPASSGGADDALAGPKKFPRTSPVMPPLVRTGPLSEFCRTPPEDRNVMLPVRSSSGAATSPVPQLPPGCSTGILGRTEFVVENDTTPEPKFATDCAVARTESWFIPSLSSRPRNCPEYCAVPVVGRFALGVATPTAAAPSTGPENAVCGCILLAHTPALE